MTEELNIIAEDGTPLFNRGEKYVIPVYQRAFAWEDREIIQLIHDVMDMKDDGVNYYIGSLVVSKTESGEYEVIDGQQRLTTLFIILKCLSDMGTLGEMRIENTLSFACREKSTYTLENITDASLDNRETDVGIIAGRDAVMDELSLRVSAEQFAEKLKRVVLYRIEVPKHTDLNRYFEIMNTRGEQLEQHDILKARLMSKIETPAKKAAFARVWEACSDMTGYVQMHFSKEMREKLFGTWWNSMPDTDLDSLACEGIEEESGEKIADIIKEKVLENARQEDGDRESYRFESIIEFPYFLLHALRVFVLIKDIRVDGLLGSQLDDKKLVMEFDTVLSVLRESGGDFAEERFAEEFVMHLLKLRYFFDMYIIKREYKGDDSEGEWSLQSLSTSGKYKNKKAYYKKTEFDYERGRDKTKINLMLQSCLRVSYTSPKVMHWITELLYWLCTSKKIYNLDKVTRDIARRAVRELYLEKCKNCQPVRYNMGVSTPHIVFNYLDFLIWESDVNTYTDFVFEFRNSVEHWYPQHPSDNTFKEVESKDERAYWDSQENLDAFGNLCIVQRRENSKFSNLNPAAKKENFKNTVNSGSLKLRIMANLTEGGWTSEKAEKHGKEMIDKLKRDVKYLKDS